MYGDRRELTKNRETSGSGKSNKKIARDGYDKLDQVEPHRRERDGLTEREYYPHRY